MKTVPDHCLSVAALILAAGSASRMGKPKQLLPYGGESLLGHAIEAARLASFGPILVVLGAGADAVQAAIAHKPVEIVRNDAWALGMGSSIAAGMRHLTLLESAAAGLALMVGDQPLVTAKHLLAMHRLFSQTAAQVVAAEYQSTVGVPAIFRRSLWGQLAGLPPESGAKSILRIPGLKLATFPLPEAAADIDTPADWERLQSS